MTDRRTARVRVAAAAAVILLSGGCSTTDQSSSTRPGESAGHAHAAHGMHGHRGHHAGRNGGTHDHATHGRAADGGRAASAAGYRLDGLSLVGEELSFRILGSNRRPATGFLVTHSKQLHLFVFRTDLSEFRHVHPVMEASGRWSVDVPRLLPGRHRVVAEFAPGSGVAGSVLLGGSVRAPGSATDRALPPPAATARVDGYTVRVDGNLLPGRTTQLHVRIEGRDGRRAALRPYLGNWAHAVLAHRDTLAVSHLHPAQEYTAGAPSPDELNLTTATRAAGRYRLIVEFATSTGRHQAEFTMLAAP